MHIYQVPFGGFDSFQNIFDNTFCRVFQPTFFGISGYLFFININDRFGINEYKLKMRKRLYSLVIPYIIWNIVDYLFIVLCYNIDVHSHIVDSMYERCNSHPLLWTIFNQPAKTQFWFVKDLIICQFASFVLYKVLARRILGIMMILSFLLIGYSLEFVPHFFFPSLPFSFFSFCIGAYLSIHKVNLKISHYGGAISLLLTVIVINYLSQMSVFNNWFFVLSWVSLTLLWYLYDLMSVDKFIQRNYDIVRKLSAASFFVYVIHYPLLDILKTSVVNFVLDDMVLCVSMYLFVPILLYFVLMFFHDCLSRKYSKVMSVLFGGR